jgi:hypothetical protein
VGEAIVVPFRTPPSETMLISEVRGALLNTSILTLRSFELYDAYLEHLKPKEREEIFSVVASTWVSMDVAMMHYRACEALDLPPSQHFEIGHASSGRVQGTVLGLVLRLAKGGGVTVWTGIGQIQRLYDRVFKGGGGVSVIKLGPKEARLEFIQNPLCALAYFRGALRGITTAGCELFCRKAIIRETQWTPTSVSFRASWA